MFQTQEYFLVFFPSASISKAKQTDTLMALHLTKGIMPIPSRLTAPRGLVKENDQWPTFGAFTCNQLWHKPHLTQGLSVSTLWTFGAGEFIVAVPSCAWRTLNSISGLCPWDASRTIPAVATKNVSGLCHSPGEDRTTTCWERLI